ncbi:MAG: pyridoxamine 5'-phosphate oxidase family protein [Nitrososphaerota archaeon]
MRGLTKQELYDFLSRSSIIARLAIVKHDGSPYIVPVWYEYDGENFYIISRAKSAWVNYLKREPRVALQISFDAPPSTRVLVEGDAEIVEGPVVGGKWVEIAKKMASRYLGERGPEYLVPTLNRPRYLIKIAPRKITSWEGVEWHPKYIDLE